ncbi:MAG: molybdenum cofactor guanylyltransferase MobA [Thiomargarita sp.]|nr:molybdenum cofactor guanylyltransferase MobA [Thiomargarita sp.]
MPFFDNSQITGVILAGGRATRMGGQDKGLVQLNQRFMIEYVIEALKPQVAQLIISANRNLEQYQKIANCPVIADSFGNYDGPLAGMVSVWEQVSTNYVLFVPCDSPLINSNLVTRLYLALIQSNADASVVKVEQRMQPTFVLLKTKLLYNLKNFLSTSERSLQRFLHQQKLIQVDFSDIPETIQNINTLAEKELFSEQFNH